jgi:OOP family OmpA-OmpF porin
MLSTLACVAACKVTIGNPKEPTQPAPPAPSAPAPSASAPAPAPTTPAPAPKKDKPKVDKTGRVQIPGNIVFEKDKADIKLDDPGTAEVLKQLKQFMDDNASVSKLRIEGHTDNDGEDAHNLDLSGRRALAVKKWLVAQGVKAERLLAVGFGESRPVADNASDQGKAQNRRTEFHIAELEGTPYLGKPVAGAAGGKVFE